MYTVYIVRRTQIYLDHGQATALAARARRRGVTASHVIREAIDEYLAEPDEEAARQLARYRAGLERTFGSVPRLEAGPVYVDQLRQADAERARSLDALRR